MSKKPINNTYITDIDKWICGCPYYLINRFSLCKHLVQLKGIVPIEFFNHIKRNIQPPFLIYDNLMSLENIENIEPNDQDLFTMYESIDEDNKLFDDLIATTKKALVLLEEQKLAGSFKWCKAVTKSFNGVTRLVKDVEQYRRKRTMPLTWKGHTDNTRYLQ